MKNKYSKSWVYVAIITDLKECSTCRVGVWWTLSDSRNLPTGGYKKGYDRLWGDAAQKKKPNYELDDLDSMLCGSIGEGFRLEGSDIDIMFWPSDTKVVMDMFQSEYYDTSNALLLLSDSSESPPGFALLQVITPPDDLETQFSLVKIKDSFYMPCSMVREDCCSTDQFIHGPCASMSVEEFAFDFAVGFACDIWPPLASS